MKYSFTINGMHCQGCVSLIKMTLEDAGFKEVSINLASRTGSIVSKNNLELLNTKLKESFKEIPAYTYSNLTLLQ